MQAQTVRRRFAEATQLWTGMDEIVARNRLPERVALELYDATIGFRLRRGSYVKRAKIEERTASRDLARLVELDLLRAVGHTRGRHYVAGPPLTRLRAETDAAASLHDPYPWMPAMLTSSGEPPVQRPA